jgi:O-antigen/teichoic acid export membrane protein
MLAYSWPLVIVAIAGVINQSSSITFQKLLLPNDLKQNLAEGGKYAAAASLAILLNLFTIAFNFAAEPFFFTHKEREDSRQVYADVALVFTIVGSVMMLVILGYMDLIQFLLGKNFRPGCRWCRYYYCRICYWGSITIFLPGINWRIKRFGVHGLPLAVQ